MDRRRRRRLKREGQKLEEKLRKEVSQLHAPGIKQPQQKPTERPRFVVPASIVKQGWKLVVGAGVLLGLWIALRPDVSAQPNVVLDPSDPFSEIFTVSNDGNLSLYAVRLSCMLNHMNVRSRTGEVGASVNNTVVTLSNIEIPEISAKTGVSAECPVSGAIRFGSPVQLSDLTINIVVSYRPPLWYRREKRICFHGAKDSRGFVHWIHCPDPN
jgi:hypothetical protein